MPVFQKKKKHHRSCAPPSLFFSKIRNIKLFFSSHSSSWYVNIRRQDLKTFLSQKLNYSDLLYWWLWGSTGGCDSWMDPLAEMSALPLAQVIYIRPRAQHNARVYVAATRVMDVGGFKKAGRGKELIGLDWTGCPVGHIMYVYKIMWGHIHRLYPAIGQESQSQCLIDKHKTTNFIISFYRQRSGISPKKWNKLCIIWRYLLCSVPNVSIVSVVEIKHNHYILEFQSWVAPLREYKIEATTVFCMHACSAAHSSNVPVVLQSFAILKRSIIC